MKRVTIYDVANEAGVSLATVSRVINGSDAVKYDTQVRVKEAIQRLGYRPNSIAQGLALNKTTMIALIIPEASFNYTGQIVNGILDVSKIYNYNIVLHTVTEGIITVNEIVDIVIKSHVDGVIIYSDKVLDENIKELNRYNVPIVLIGNKISSDSISSVYVDIEKAIYELASKYLVDGIEDIAIIQDRKNSYTTKQMLEGAKRAFKNQGKEFNNLIEIPQHYRSSYKFLTEYFRDHKHSLVIANRDSQALAVLNSAKENNIKVPDEMEVVCIIDTKYNSMYRPTITSFSIPSYDLGAVSMRLMTKMLKGDELEDKVKCLSYLYTPRQTTKN
ncbi:MAG: LacI family DNA-binding transcriptional regulator [Erysipelotrichaceae bacterium]|jgi:LacI family transcriptional regulator|nr:LacI family DNA-binding transcriptional regulator [Erysipelotrichaceae bacterium]